MLVYDKYSFNLKLTMKKIFWKIYFWLLLVAILSESLRQGLSRAWEIVDVVFTLVSMLGLFAFCWQKKLFSAMFWKIFFGSCIVWNIFQQYILPWPQVVQEAMEQEATKRGMDVLSQPVAATINIIFYIPLFVALYLYAFKNRLPKNNKE